MDLDVLSAENYQEVSFDRGSSEQLDSGNTQLYGGNLASSTIETKALKPYTSMKTRRPSKKNAFQGVSTDDSATRQRGRPRLDNRDQTAAEVCPRGLTASVRD